MFDECSSLIYLHISDNMVNKLYDKMHKNNNQKDSTIITVDTPADNAPLHRPVMLSCAARTHALNC